MTFYAFSISRRDNTRSIKGLMPSSLEIANDSSRRGRALVISVSHGRNPGFQRVVYTATGDGGWSRSKVSGAGTRE